MRQRTAKSAIASILKWQKFVCLSQGYHSIKAMLISFTRSENLKSDFIRNQNGQNYTKEIDF